MEVHVVMTNYTERKKICIYSTLPCEILIIVFYFKPLFIKMRLAEHARIQEHPDSTCMLYTNVHLRTTAVQSCSSLDHRRPDALRISSFQSQAWFCNIHQSISKSEFYSAICEYSDTSSSEDYIYRLDTWSRSSSMIEMDNLSMIPFHCNQEA